MRTVYAAAHVVADPIASANPWQAPAADWEATLAFRRHLWGLGLMIAEAMDTSQRGMDLDWNGARAILMASRALCRVARSKDDYLTECEAAERKALPHIGTAAFGAAAQVRSHMLKLVHPNNVRVA